MDKWLRYSLNTHLNDVWDISVCEYYGQIIYGFNHTKINVLKLFNKEMQEQSFTVINDYNCICIKQDIIYKTKFMAEYLVLKLEKQDAEKFILDDCEKMRQNEIKRKLEQIEKIKLDIETLKTTEFKFIDKGN